ncbi:serine/threonine-protein kinase [Sphaerisporangium corydalis]|uniref:Serine/threonine-protein kinase n=1 Tax=Sphaerisporangium corydalis TaxID=1441875 RepID=A0ABV9EV54_9ACTN|nr:serine/threonine-protein kinase [Sphaerisporangium corydalis]
MPGTTPLRPSDPATVGDYRIVGRLGSGGQGVVYLAEPPEGEPVAIKMLHASPDTLSAMRFRRESEVLPKVASFCTAQVLETGFAGTVPYIVSEYIDGPTLQEAVAQRGPLHGRELHRLAVGTITALAAIHRAGVVHRDFKPANVLLSRDGPRVIDFGIARQAGGDVTEGGPIGTPSYMAPEQLGDTPAGPPADMFAWACTMVFAATGRPPFGADSLPAILNRVLHSDPDLGGLEGELGDLATACLAKDPRARPMSRQVLLQLLGRPAAAPTGAAGQEELAAGSSYADRPTATRRPRRLAVVLVAACLLVGAGLVYRVLPKGSTTATPRPTPSVAVSTATAGPLPTTAREVAIPDLGAKVYENPADPLRLTAFIHTDSNLIFTAAWRSPDGAFHDVEERMMFQVSPDRTGMAGVQEFPQYAQGDGNEVHFAGRLHEDEFRVPTVARPLAVRGMIWSEDSRRVLLTTYDATASTGDSVGFAIVDRETRKTTVVKVDGAGTGRSNFVWAPGDAGVVRAVGKNAEGVRFYGLDGRLQRTLKGLRVPEDSVPVVSSKGRMAALCPGKRHAACVVDPATGARQATVPLPKDSLLWFWFGQDHLGIYDKSAKRPQLRALDLTGRTVRVLADFTPGTTWLVHWSSG